MIIRALQFTLTPSVGYLYKDHLGSTDTVINTANNALTKMSFDSYGSRRRASGLYEWTTNSLLYSTTTLQNLTDKGYTGHEQLDNVGLIHMNGRVYDPLMGRFLSADPNIQAPTDTQSLNRYAYVLNNPLSATDPSGYFSLKKWIKPIIAAVAAYYTFGAISAWVEQSVFTSGFIAAGGWSGITLSQTYSLLYTSALAGSIAGGAAAGFVAGGILTGTAKGAFTGAVSGAIAGYANFGELNGFWDGSRRIAASAAGGCLSGKLSGGSCSRGAKLAGMAQTLKVAMDAISGYTSSLKTSKGDAVIKIKGTGVQNPDVTNVGKSIEVLPDSRAVSEGLVGRSVKSLSHNELDILQGSLEKKGSLDFIKWSTSQNKVVFNPSLGYYTSEYSPGLQWTSEHIPGFRSFSVFHDRILANSTNGFLLAVTIPPTIYAQYYALGLKNYYYDYKNLER